jgi:hypothetical protein
MRLRLDHFSGLDEADDVLVCDGLDRDPLLEDLELGAG